MEILFKEDNNWMYYINDDNVLDHDHTDNHPDVDLSNITQLDDKEVLYHYIDNETKEKFSVYYEHEGAFVTKRPHGYVIYSILKYYIKDYTLINLKILEDGDII